MITLIGILAGLLVYIIFAPPYVRKGSASQRIAEIYSLDTARALSELKPDSLDYKLLASGVRLQPITFRLLTLAVALGASIAAWPFLPGLPSFVIAGITFYVPYAWLSDKVKSRGREIERILPVAISRITAGLVAGRSVPDVLQMTGESLAAEGPNPLTPELLLTAAELYSKERLSALRSLAARSPSTSLANLAYLLEGLSESGGARYAEALTRISQRVQQILVARNRATAKAGDAMVTARIIPGMLLFVFVFLTRDPLIQSSLQAFPVQVLIAAGIGMMAVGYVLMRSIVGEAV